jgi:hypothetical protein
MATRWGVDLKALSRAVEDSAEHQNLLTEGKAMLALGTVAHNHFWFYRDVIEGCLSSSDAEGVLDHVMR